MGIPSYFSHIINNHGNVLCRYLNILSNNIHFSRLYMDCNSILYDVYHKIPSTEPIEMIESILLEKTSIQIEQYINQVRPTDVVYIAFDGVAPIAKMEQQRNRRYKSWFESSVINIIENKQSVDPIKTSCMFTPGTTFMKKLSTYMRKKFEHSESRYRINKIIVATPDEPGEGEHKLFAHLRDYPCDPTENCALYGLDADLMMLSLFHLSYCQNIYIFRESPTFAKKLLEKTNNDTMQEDEPLFVNVSKLGNSIANDMRCSYPDTHRMYDYVFMCFLLGNDFLPHFPSLNIRTSGIQILLDTYRMVIGNKKECFLLSKSNPPKIQWKHVSIFIEELAKHEHSHICQEYSVRKKWDYKPVSLRPKKTTKERLDLFQNTPVLYRKEEHYINPYQSDWEMRYYGILFPEKTNAKDVILNYLEGLEWVYNYYLIGKVDWEWKYKYHYPPLLKDLAPHVPHLKTTFLKNKKTKPISSNAQLAYVLPPIYHHLLNASSVNQYKEYYSGYNINNDGVPILDFQWAFCRYFWECHVQLPHIPNDIVQKWNES